MTEIDEFYEREYNTTLSVPDEMDYINRWVEQSAAARTALTGHLDLAYGATVREKLDLFPAPGSSILHVHIHGGFWRVMSKSEASWIAPPFVRAGVSVAVLDYALCPTVTLETIVEQCRRAVAWLYQHAQDYGVRADKIVVSGHSAGGHLTAMLFATDWTHYGVPSSIFRAGIALSGLFYLESLTHTHINDDIRLDAPMARSLSPSELRPTISAPLYIGVGAEESSEFQRQSQILCAAWEKQCIGPHLLAQRHHFTVLDDLVNLNGELWRTPALAGLIAPTPA